MSCATCGHTMHFQGNLRTNQRLFWCPRCGSLMLLKCEQDEIVDLEVPQLVQRCREYQRSELVTRFWFVEGIAESIHPPEARTALEDPA